MLTKLIELRPDRNLLNPDFNGYKLSLKKIPVFTKKIETAVERVLPNSEQYSLLHAKLFGLHNYLFADQFTLNDSVYFIDGSWHVQKISFDNLTNQMRPIHKVWEIPHCNDLKSGRYNLSLYFVSKNLAVLSDGIGTLHVICTGDRTEDEYWSCIFFEEILESNQSFTIVDAVYINSENNEKELHCLLNSVESNEGTDKFCTVINWVTLRQTEDSKWGAVSLKILKGCGQLYYCALERNSKYVYIASDKPFKFILDSENPILEKVPEPTIQKTYTWLQTEEIITIRLKLVSECKKSDILVDCESTKILVKYEGTVLLQGDLQQRIDTNLTTWTVVNENILEIVITKTESGLMWPEFIVGDNSGEHLIDPMLVSEMHQKLAHLCNDTKVLPAETGPTFSSHPVEECDFTGDDTALFERICGFTHSVTHRINLGSLQLITSVKLNANLPPALALRHDVDACLWQPIEFNGDWTMKHEGTLLAFGYVQASKQQRKFSTCSSRLTYSVICESTRHVFIYGQQRKVVVGELRNRHSGQRVNIIAEQQVVNVGEDEILGIFAANQVLYLLTELSLHALKIT